MTTPPTDADFVEAVCRGSFPEWAVFSEHQRERCRKTIALGLTEAHRAGWRWRNIPFKAVGETK